MCKGWLEKGVFTKMTVQYLPSQPIQVLAEVDVVVVGGSFAGVSSALRLASIGQKVMIVESRTYLGREMTATLRPWLKVVENNSKVADLITSSIKHTGKTTETKASKYVCFHMDKVKRHLEDRVLESEVQLLYASLPVGFVQNDQHELEGIIIANKSGRQLIRCKKIIDTTETAIMSFFTNDRVLSFGENSQALYKKVLEFDNIKNFPEGIIEVPEHLNVYRNQVAIYRGYHGDNHIYVEYSLKLESENSLEAAHSREVYGQMHAMDVAEYLIQTVPEFRRGLLCSSSNELHGPYLENSDEMPQTKLDLSSLAVSVPSIWCFYKDLFINENIAWHDPAIAAMLAEEFIDLIEDHKNKKDCKYPLPILDVAEEEVESAYEVKIPTNFIEKPSDYIKVPKAKINLHSQASILVAGAGSSGGIASVISAEEGVDTLVTDLNPGFGGTGTFGGVDSYWFGKRHGYAKRITDLVNAVQIRINYKGHKWNIEAKKYALLQEATAKGVRTLFNVIAFGAITKETKVCGTVVATRWGPCSILADCVIDATGDGDVAAFAGAEFEYGSSRDHVVMWYSLAQFNQPGKTQNNFTSMVNVSDIKDYTRAILAGRRRDRGNGCHDHGIYVAPRESRHILGEVVMTMTDQLLQRSWPDVINVHFSNHDMKGVSAADWMNTGLIPPNLEIEIPYRMLIPKKLDGIILAGKALSATHDALPAIRMQSDLENLGGIVGLAAVQAIRDQEMPREIDLPRLQSRIVQEGLMPSDVIKRNSVDRYYSEQELVNLVNDIEVDAPLYEYSNMRMNEIYKQKIPFVEICAVGERIVPFLEKAHEEAVGIKRVRIAQALAMYGSNVGVSTLINEIESMLQEEELPKRTAEILYVTMPPDHGAMPDVCYLLYSLAMTSDERAIKVWERVVELFNPTEEDFKDPWWGLFYYVHSICTGAERLGSKNAIPVLKELHENQYLSGQQTMSHYQADYFLERRAMLELSIGRSLARCGSKQGFETLINYLDDVRSLLSKQAYTELTKISGVNLLKDKQKWLDWLGKNEHKLTPCPYKERLDLVYQNDGFS